MQEIKVGEITFKDVTMYYKDDKIRNRRRYVATVDGLQIVVHNKNSYNEKMYFSCEGIGIGNMAFTNPSITFENACKASITHVKTKLIKLCGLLNSTTGTPQK